MKTTARQLFILGCGLVVSSLTAQNGTVIPAEILKIEEPRFPSLAETESIFEGTITVLVDLDDKGTVTDFLPLTASSRYLLEPVSQVIYDWQFKPAQRGAVPARVIKEIEISFQREGLLVVSASSNITRLFAGGVPQRVNYVVQMSDLDQLPTPIDLVRPSRFRNMTAEQMNGRVVFDFFIDEKGRVRMPIVVDLEGDFLLAESAAIALQQWRFEPPLKKGRPVTVRARQEFVFGQ